MARKKRVTFTEDFKKNAVKLVEKLGSQKEAAEQLGVSEVNLHNWRKKFHGKSLPKPIQRARAKQRLSKESSNEGVNSLLNRIRELEEKNEMMRKIIAALSQEVLLKD